jgi:hypothetical protein
MKGWKRRLVLWQESRERTARYDMVIFCRKRSPEQARRLGGIEGKGLCCHHYNEK